jgi:hypothetical protein
MIQRVDKDYLELSEALLKLGCAVDKMFPDRATEIEVTMPEWMHQEIFGSHKGFHEVFVRGPFGQYRMAKK